jgi:hypothetical protein
MSDGHHFQCKSCANEWQRYQTKRTIGPPSEFTYNLRCAECDFTLVVPFATDGSSWRKWKSRNGELLMSIRMIADYSETVDRLIGSSSYSVVRLPEPQFNCPGCDQMMELGLLDKIYRCPKCHTLDVVVIGEFAESISFVDPKDMLRWWTRIGV